MQVSLTRTCLIMSIGFQNHFSTQNLLVRSVGASSNSSNNNSNTINPIPITVDIGYIENNQTLSISQYLYEKVVFDSSGGSDTGLGIIISEDVYPTNYSESSATGEIDIKLRRVSSKFEVIKMVLNNIWVA